MSRKSKYWLDKVGGPAIDVALTYYAISREGLDQGGAFLADLKVVLKNLTIMHGVMVHAKKDSGNVDLFPETAGLRNTGPNTDSGDRAAPAADDGGSDNTGGSVGTIPGADGSRRRRNA